MPNTIEHYSAALHKPDIDGQAAAAEALAALGEAARPAIVALVQVCGSQSEDVRNWCTAALEDVGAPAANQIEDLTLLAKSANSDVAYWAVTLLGRAGGQAASSVPTLIERLSDRSAPPVQQKAAWALGLIGPDDAGVVRALRSAAAGADAPLATQAEQALAKIRAA